MSNSYTPPDRSTYDPGWNDIPISVTTAMNGSLSAGKPRLNLSKRVAFPMQSGASTSCSNVKTTSAGLPLPYSTAKYQPLPDMNPTIALAKPSSVLATPPQVALFNPIQNVPNITADPMQCETSNEPFDSVAAREYCHSIFMRLIDQMDKSIDAVKLTEMRKRIDLLNDMWVENKFDKVVQLKLYDLGRALEKNDVSAAEEVHRFLVTDHINAATKWATALRQIIHSISGIESFRSNEADPFVLTSNETVQFMDFSVKPVVFDASPFPPQVPIIPELAPILPINNPTDDVASNAEINQQSNESSSSKSKTSRFSRILHL